MIVRATSESWILVTQPDHARLSGDLIAAWRRDGLDAHPRRPEILAAVSSHDDGWAEPDREPIWSEDGPLDFVTAPVDVRLGVWPRGVDRVRAHHGPYAAALVALHPLALFEAFGTPAPARPLVERLEQRVAELLREDGVATRDETDGAYRFVALGDLLSLVFCNGWTGERESAGVRVRLEGARLVVDPDPFGGREVPFTVPARRIERARYPSPAALRDAWNRAGLFTLEGVAAGA